MFNFTAYQHKQIARRYLAQVNSAMSKAHNNHFLTLAQKHIEAYMAMTGKDFE